MLREILPEEAVRAIDEERALLERVRAFVAEFDADGAEAARVRELLEHLEDMFLLVVVGEVKAGKSSFINALLRSDVCPEGPLPLTDRVHVLAHGDTDHEAAVEDHVTRRTVPVESLRHMNVVDTPGTNSPLRRHQEITESFLPRADIVFFVTSIDCPLTQTELQLLGDIRRRWKKEIACILAKIDIRTPKDRTVVLEYLRQSFREHLGFEPPVFPVSSALAREAHAEGDDEKLEASGLAEVERYVVENLSESQRVLLKLRSPLGTVADVLSRVDATASNQLQVLDRDFAGWNSIKEQVDFASTSLRERAERQLSPIHVAFENLEARGRRFLRESIRVTNLRLFADAGRFRAAFDRDVVRGAAEEIERKVDDAATWLAQETRSLWERSLSHFNDTVSLDKYRDEIAAGAGPKFQETREETLQRIRTGARGHIESWSVEAECSRVRQLASRSLTRVLGTEVVAAGLGAAVVAALVPAGIGIVLAAGIALSGFFILPARRQKAVEGFEKGVRETRDAVLVAVREAISEESDRAAAAVLDAFTPFHDFYEAKKRSLGSVREGIEGLRADVAAFRAELG